MELTPRLRKGKRMGFTLTELVVTGLIVGILLVLVSHLVAPLSRMIRINMARGEIQREMRTTIRLMEPLLRQAKRETIVLPGATPLFSKVGFQTMDGRQFLFYQSGKNLFMQEGARPPLIISRLLGRMLFVQADHSGQNYILSLHLSKSPGAGDKPVSKFEKLRIVLRDR